MFRGMGDINLCVCVYIIECLNVLERKKKGNKSKRFCFVCVCVNNETCGGTE